MEAQFIQHDMHKRALIWKATLQELIALQQSTFENIMNGKYKFIEKGSHVVWKQFSKTIKGNLQEIDRLQQRISNFENRLSLLRNWGFSLSHIDFWEEADAISLCVQTAQENMTNTEKERTYIIA